MTQCAELWVSVCSKPISPGSIKHPGGSSALSGCGYHELRTQESRIQHFDQTLAFLLFSVYDMSCQVSLRRNLRLVS